MIYGGKADFVEENVLVNLEITSDSCASRWRFFSTHWLSSLSTLASRRTSFFSASARPLRWRSAAACASANCRFSSYTKKKTRRNDNKDGRDESHNQSINQSTPKSINKPRSQSINQCTNKPRRQSIKQSTHRSVESSHSTVPYFFVVPCGCFKRLQPFTGILKTYFVYKINCAISFSYTNRCESDVGSYQWVIQLNQWEQLGDGFTVPVPCFRDLRFVVNLQRKGGLMTKNFAEEICHFF